MPSSSILILTTNSTWFVAISSKAVLVDENKNILKKDVATSMVAVSSQEIQELPVSNVDNVVSKQAGIQGGLQIRGGMADQALFLMDGATLRDPRNNQPISSVPMSAVKELDVERGGFNAEYGQVQSGIEIFRREFDHLRVRGDGIGGIAGFQEDSRRDGFP